MSSLQRVCVSLRASRGEQIPDETFVPVFHEWIRDRAIGSDLVLLDVADYSHVPEGPGVMLVSHSITFSLDRADGQLGLVAQRRRPGTGDTADTIADLVRHADDLATALESHPRLAGRIAFDRSVVRVEANDRLLAPNSAEGCETLAVAVRSAWTALRPERPVALTRLKNDPRDRLAIEVRQ
jgi:hypothetical protein